MGPPQPWDHDSERVFAEYLDHNGIGYKRTVVVNPGNVDFEVSSRGTAVYCDVKAVEQRPTEYGRVEAHFQIRDDLHNLRRKFSDPPNKPCVLVTMNYSGQIFTSTTVRTAMLGDLAITFIVTGENVETTPIHHSPTGNAALRKGENTRISGILVIDVVRNDHCYLANPYARFPLPLGFFPGAYELAPKKADNDSELLEGNEITFLPLGIFKKSSRRG
jgi:hypothetical protein